MQKIASILFIIITLAGCSLIKKSSVREMNEINSYNITINDIIRNNIGRGNFYIEKAEVSYNSDSIKERFLVNLTFEHPDKFLISLRSKTGYEAIRIFLGRDTFLINDRINQKLYYGKDKFLVNKFGLSSNIIPVIFGDLVLGSKSDSSLTPCIGNILRIESALKGQKLNYSINCNLKKVNYTVLEYNTGKRFVELRFEKMKHFGDLIVPTQITMNDVRKNIMIRINIIKIHSGISDSIEFIPGKKYEKIELL